MRAAATVMAPAGAKYPYTIISKLTSQQVHGWSTNCLMPPKRLSHGNMLSAGALLRLVLGMMYLMLH